MYLNSLHISCGIMQLFSVQRVDNTLASAKDKLNKFLLKFGSEGRRDENGIFNTYPFCPSILIFSDVADNFNGGESLAMVIESEPMYGTVTRSAPTLNYNSGNSIVLYTWYLNPEFVMSRNKRYLHGHGIGWQQQYDVKEVKEHDTYGYYYNN